MKLAIVSILFVATQVHAVEIRNCPKDFSVHYSSYSILNGEDVSDDVSKLRRNLKEASRVSDAFVLVGTKTGRCEYESGGFSAVLATSKGMDWLRIKKGRLLSYVTITQYTPTGLVAKGRASFGYSTDHGFIGEKLGTAKIEFR